MKYAYHPVDTYSDLQLLYGYNGNNQTELARCWKEKLSYWSGQNFCLKNQIFHAATSHSLSFQAAILKYCATWKARMPGILDNKDIFFHVDQARQGSAEADQNLQPMGRSILVMALTGMALQEEMLGGQGAA